MIISGQKLCNFFVRNYWQVAHINVLIFQAGLLAEKRPKEEKMWLHVLSSMGTCTSSFEHNVL